MSIFDNNMSKIIKLNAIFLNKCWISKQHNTMLQKVLFHNIKVLGCFSGMVCVRSIRGFPGTYGRSIPIMNHYTPYIRAYIYNHIYIHVLVHICYSSWSDVTYVRKQCTLEHEYLTFEHAIERLTSSATCERTKGSFLVITILNIQHLAVVFCILSNSHIITRCLFIRNFKCLMN